MAFEFRRRWENWENSAASMTDAKFEALVAASIGALGAYARALCGNVHDADDAVATTLERAWKYFDTFDHRGSFEGWLIRICRNCIIDQSRRRAVVTVSEVVQPADESHGMIDLISALPVQQREVVVVCGLLGYDYESAAQLLDIPVGTVRSRLSRGRAALATLLERADTA